MPDGLRASIISDEERLSSPKPHKQYTSRLDNREAPDTIQSATKRETKEA